MAKLPTFWSVKYTPLVGKHSKFHKTFIPWQHITENVISQQNPGKPICRNSNANLDPLNWPNMSSYSGLENKHCKMPDIKTYRHVLPYKFPVSVSSFIFWGRISVFRPGLKNWFWASKLVRLLVKNNFRKKKEAVILLLR